MEIQLSLEFLRVVEQAAIAAARTMGQGDRHMADDVAVEAMRTVMDSVPMDGTIVIGEGERDEAPMLYIGEKVGAAQHNKNLNCEHVDIAVDLLSDIVRHPKFIPDEVEKERSRSSAMGMAGVQIQTSRAAIFAQETIMPSNNSFLFRSVLNFFEFGIRINFGSSIDQD